MKKLLKGFTLVEILIVIVIIGILIGALVPRMQSAQGRARDVARKNDLSQIQSAIVTSYSDKGEWPHVDDDANDGISVGDISSELEAAGLNGVPTDPIKGNAVVLGSSDNEITGGYGYMVGMKNGVSNAGFVLMAHTEVEGGSNWIFCSGADALSDGLIESSQELKEVVPCQKMTYDKDGDCAIDTENHDCEYNDPTQLRYIMVY